jgi:ParB-like chromosome segregation protein Spo0J
MQDLGDNRPQPVIRDRGERELQKKINRLERLVVTYVSPEELIPNSYNPNRQNERDFELLCRSITEDGFTQPIVAIRDGNVIVDGEHRWRAAKKLGYVKIPVVFVDMTHEQMRVATLRHNRARGSEDVQLSAEVLRDLRELGALDWAKDSLMMSQEEMDKILSDVPVVDQLAGEEFTESWAHVQHSGSTEVSDLAKVKGKNILESATPQAQEKINSALKKSEELPPAERAEFMKSVIDDTFRIAVSFLNEEAEIVKNALGTAPAERLLEFCKAELGVA